MGLKVKAVERLLRFDKNSAGEYRYVMKPEVHTKGHPDGRPFCI